MRQDHRGFFTMPASSEDGSNLDTPGLVKASTEAQREIPSLQDGSQDIHDVFPFGKGCFLLDGAGPVSCLRVLLADNDSRIALDLRQFSLQMGQCVIIGDLCGTSFHMLLHRDQTFHLDDVDIRICRGSDNGIDDPRRIVDHCNLRHPDLMRDHRLLYFFCCSSSHFVAPSIALLLLIIERGPPHMYPSLSPSHISQRGWASIPPGIQHKYPLMHASQTMTVSGRGATVSSALASVASLAS